MQHAMPYSRRPSRALLLAIPVVLALYGCTSEKIVYRDREPFNEPVAAAKGFLGYFSAETKQTTCGNCHADKQADWQETAHANAWSALPANAAESCKDCHTVGELGNGVTGAAGYAATHDSIYYDVQCESCHGPGLEHVTGVVNANLIRPLAKLTMPGDGTCADCHSGQHQPFVEEWSQSAHALIVSSAASRSTCNSCHDGRGALRAWGEQTNYAERDVAAAYQPTTCSVCHDPHGSPNTKQLRFAIDTPDPELNLCMKCHMRRTEPATGSTHGVEPHAPQGAVLLGIAGYRPAGFVYPEDRIFSTHGTDANPRVCAGCHVTRFTVNDPQGGFVFQATGHLFRPIPCLDPQGIPTGDKNCEYSSTARSWKSCTQSGCHANAGVAASAFNTVRARMKLLTDQLWTDSDHDDLLEASPTDAGMLPTVRAAQASEWAPDSRISPAEGAEFNARLCGEYGQENTDNSKGIHNPFLCEALLIASINDVRTTYGLPSPPAAVQAILNGPVGGPFANNVKVSGRQIPGYELRQTKTLK